MVEVFKTNVTSQEHANMLVNRLHEIFPPYKVNFDLDDCDNILRIKSANGSVECFLVIDILKEFGFAAEVLPDDPPPVTELLRSKGYL